MSAMSDLSDVSDATGPVSQAESPEPATRARDREAVELELMDLLAYIYLQNGLPDKAAVLAAARDVLQPEQPRVLMTLAVAQLRAAKPQRTLDTLDRLAILGAMDATFHLVRGQALQALGRHEEAASAMRAFVAMRPADSADTTQDSEPQAATR